jgi:hypothetical protein
MANLNGHEIGNGGYIQRDTYGNSAFLAPTLPAKLAKDSSISCSLS